MTSAKEAALSGGSLDIVDALDERVRGPSAKLTAQCCARARARPCSTEGHSHVRPRRCAVRALTPPPACPQHLAALGYHQELKRGITLLGRRAQPPRARGPGACGSSMLPEGG